jgi:hypothetical protein
MNSFEMTEVPPEQADTIPELAKKLELDPAELDKTITECVLRKALLRRRRRI